jgi:hypothetical protein
MYPGTTDNKKVYASAHFARSSEVKHGVPRGAAPETSNVIGTVPFG